MFSCFVIVTVVVLVSFQFDLLRAQPFDVPVESRRTVLDCWVHVEESALCGC